MSERAVPPPRSANILVRTRDQGRRASFESSDGQECPRSYPKQSVRVALLVAVMTVVTMVETLSVVEAAPAPGATATAPGPATDLNDQLETLRSKHKLPALAAAVIKGQTTLALGAVGVRKDGGSEKVTIEDKFHIGSCTKSMTATLAAMLVEEGKLKWTTQIAETFPERVAAMHADYREMTLEQLLSHRGGAPASLDADGLWGRIWKHKGTPTEQRLFLFDGVVSKPPEATPGTKYIYSNAGYAIAGAMLERITGTPWEELVRERLFKRLGMASAGFGAPASAGKVDQPWGHTAGLLGRKPVPPGPGADNPVAIGPAGTVHCSIGDLAKYAAFHLQGARGEGRLLKADSFKKLHTPIEGQEYALGWLVVQRGWAGGTTLTHAGSNTMFYTVIWIAPKKNFAVIVATNLGGDEAEKACDETAGKLIQEFLPK
ncbi:MAG: beta-lactamase family protein [Verrucomicrobia bacterium]|nr:beta-lactamase family protein [Verrucomicrobiota bacterium]